MEWKTIKIEAPGISSLCWCGDELVDFVNGGVRYRLDGSKSAPQFEPRPDFDAAICSADEKFVVLYKRMGQNGLVLHRETAREIRRDGYRADIHEYPVAIWKWFDGRYVMAHCPDSYCRLEIEYLDTGERLTTRTSDSPDYFHSRLSVTANGRYLMTCGWIWHPLERIQAYDLLEVSKNPEILDKPVYPDLDFISEFHDDLYDINAAVLIGNDEAIFSSYLYPSRHSYQGIWNIASNQVHSIHRVDGIPQKIMPLNTAQTVNFYDRPKLIDVESGKILFSWDDIYTGKASGAIVRNALKGIYIAADPKHSRFAVASNNEVWVVMFKG